MSIDPHWLKNQFKDISTDDLLCELVICSIFDHGKSFSMIQAELERRDKEPTHER